MEIDDLISRLGNCSDLSEKLEVINELGETGNKRAYDFLSALMDRAIEIKIERSTTGQVQGFSLKIIHDILGVRYECIRGSYNTLDSLGHTPEKFSEMFDYPEPFRSLYSTLEESKKKLLKSLDRRN